jgi:hypothetical protein
MTMSRPSLLSLLLAAALLLLSATAQSCQRNDQCSSSSCIGPSAVFTCVSGQCQCRQRQLTPPPPSCSSPNDCSSPTCTGPDVVYTCVSGQCQCQQREFTPPEPEPECRVDTDCNNFPCNTGGGLADCNILDMCKYWEKDVCRGGNCACENDPSVQRCAWTFRSWGPGEDDYTNLSTDKLYIWWLQREADGTWTELPGREIYASDSGNVGFPSLKPSPNSFQLSPISWVGYAIREATTDLYK